MAGFSLCNLALGIEQCVPHSLPPIYRFVIICPCGIANQSLVGDVACPEIKFTKIKIQIVNSKWILESGTIESRWPHECKLWKLLSHIVCYLPWYIYHHHCRMTCWAISTWELEGCHHRCLTHQRNGRRKAHDLNRSKSTGRLNAIFVTRNLPLEGTERDT